MLIPDLYSIESFDQDDQTVSATVKLNPKHEVFAGHFPGNPILPGVCTIQIIKELTEKALQKDLLLSVTSNVKFMAKINPQKNDTITLTLILTEVEDGSIKVKNTTTFEETTALKMNAVFNPIKY